MRFLPQVSEMEMRSSCGMKVAPGIEIRFSISLGHFESRTSLFI
jgi:hypothetical protein